MDGQGLLASRPADCVCGQHHNYQIMGEARAARPKAVENFSDDEIGNM